MIAPGGMTALVLAGSRAGRPDPIAERAGVSHKALLPVGGVPMILRVIMALRGCPAVGRIIVSAESAEILAGLPDARALSFRPSDASPSRSVASILEEFGTPLLVTTADHALLTSEILQHFVLHAPGAVDAVAAVARSEVVLAAYPGTRRTWIHLRDGGVSGCNLFILCGPRAWRAVAFWRRLEQQRKRPLAMARIIGPAALFGYALRMLTLQGAVRLLARRVGAKLAVVPLPFAAAAIDVDKQADLILVEAVLASRETTRVPTHAQA